MAGRQPTHLPVAGQVEPAIPGQKVQARWEWVRLLARLLDHPRQQQRHARRTPSGLPQPVPRPPRLPLIPSALPPLLQPDLHAAQKVLAADQVREGALGEGPGTPIAVPLTRGTQATSTGARQPRRGKPLCHAACWQAASCVLASLERYLMMPVMPAWLCGLLVTAAPARIPLFRRFCCSLDSSALVGRKPSLVSPCSRPRGRHAGHWPPNHPVRWRWRCQRRRGGPPSKAEAPWTASRMEAPPLPRQPRRCCHACRCFLLAHRAQWGIPAGRCCGASASLAAGQHGAVSSASLPAAHRLPPHPSGHPAAGAGGGQGRGMRPHR